MTGVQGAVPTRYELVTRSQAGAEQFLRDLGALAEIEEALLGHCETHWPDPPYKPEEYKKRLAKFGWQPEVRVPPYGASDP